MEVIIANLDISVFIVLAVSLMVLLRLSFHRYFSTGYWLDVLKE